MASGTIPLTETCDTCAQAVAHLNAIQKLTLDFPQMEVTSDGKVVKALDINCDVCHNTRLVLTNQGKEMLEAIKPILSDVNKLTTKDLAKAEKAAKQPPAVAKTEVK